MTDASPQAAKAADGKRRPVPGLVWIMVGGGLILLLSVGSRQAFGLYQVPMVEAKGWGRETFSLAIAVQNLVWGLAEPFFGRLADRFGSRPVVIGSVGLWVLGLWLMSNPGSPVELYLGGGLIVGMALAASAFGVVLGAVGRAAPAHRRGMAMGVAGAIGSVGHMILIPVNHALIDVAGWSDSLLIVAFGMISLALLALMLRAPREGGPSSLTGNPLTDLQTGSQALREAFGHSGYWLLMIGFFVCGFQVTFIGTHVVAYIGDVGLSPEIASGTLTLIGLGNILGSFVFSSLGDKFPRKYLLSLMYLGRAAFILMLVLLPPSPVVALGFGFLMGLLWLGTVPLTSGLVAQIFGVRHMSMLFGFVFFTHQIGAALGVWLGGFMYDQTGSYDLVWLIAAGLGVLAAFVHYPIADKPLPRLSDLAAEPAPHRTG